MSQACNVVSAGAWTRTAPSATTGRWASRSRTQAYRHGLAEPAVDRENLDSTEDRVYLDGPARFALRVGTPHRGSTKAMMYVPAIAALRQASDRAVP